MIRHTLKLKTDSITDSVTESVTAIYNEDLGAQLKTYLPQPETKNRLCH